MNKKTYIVEENQIRLKPDVEKPQEPDKRLYVAQEPQYNSDLYHYKCNLEIYEEILSNSPTYPKSGDWSGYAEGQEISEDEVEMVNSFKTGTNYNPLTGDYFAEPALVAIPKKKEAPATGSPYCPKCGSILAYNPTDNQTKCLCDYTPATGQGMGEAEAIANKVFPNGTAGDTHFDYLQGVRREAFIEGLMYQPTPQGSGQGMKWVKHLGQQVSFGYEGRKKEGIIEGFHPVYGVVIFVPSNVFVPHHYVREELIEWPEPPQQKEGTPTTEPQERSDKEIEEPQFQDDAEIEFERCSDCDGHDACEDFGCAIKAGIPINPPL